VTQILYRDSVVYLLIVSLACAVYWAGLPGGYVFDDYPNIVRNSFVNRESWNPGAFLIAALSGESGPTGRPISMLSFAVDSFLWDLNPVAMKWENIVLHGITGCVFFCLCRRLLSLVGLAAGRAHVIALIGACLWVLHPINLTSVLYIVQRMNLLATLFGCMALVAYLSWRIDLFKNHFNWSYFFAFCVFVSLGIFSKENGILVFLYVVIIETVIFQPRSVPGSRNEIILRRLMLLALGAVSVIAWFVAISDPGLIARGYGGRDFTVDQRFLTEFRVVSWYILQLFSPSLQELSLYHDDVALSYGILKPLTTLFSALFLITLFAIAIATKRRLPFISLSIFLFLASQLLESFTVGLEIAYEHRVYFGGFWLLAASVYAISLLTKRLEVPLRQITIAVAVTGMIAVFSFQTHIRAAEWSSPVGLIFAEVNRSPGSYRANVTAGGVMASRIEDAEPDLDDYFDYLKATSYFDKAMTIDSSQASACIAGLILESRYQGEAPANESVSACKKSLAMSVDSSSLNSLGLLVKCVADLKCSDGDYVLDLLDTAFTTFGTGGGRQRAILLAERASYYARVRSDLEVSSLLLMRAIELNPRNEINYLKLIDVWVQRGQIEAARSVGRQLQEIDYLKKYTGVYEALELDED
jgi:hypothetical protein